MLLCWPFTPKQPSGKAGSTTRRPTPPSNTTADVWGIERLARLTQPVILPPQAIWALHHASTHCTTQMATCQLGKLCWQQQVAPLAACIKHSLHATQADYTSPTCNRSVRSRGWPLGGPCPACTDLTCTEFQKVVSSSAAPSLLFLCRSCWWGPLSVCHDSVQAQHLHGEQYRALAATALAPCTGKRQPCTYQVDCYDSND